MYEDLNIMWSTFHYYKIKGPIEVDMKVARSTKVIQKMLRRP